MYVSHFPREGREREAVSEDFTMEGEDDGRPLQVEKPSRMPRPM